jgi:hypothetical protein
LIFYANHAQNNPSGDKETANMADFSFNEGQNDSPAQIDGLL